MCCVFCNLQHFFFFFFFFFFFVFFFKFFFFKKRRKHKKKQKLKHAKTEWKCTVGIRWEWDDIKQQPLRSVREETIGVVTDPKSVSPVVATAQGMYDISVVNQHIDLKNMKTKHLNTHTKKNASKNKSKITKESRC